MSDRISVQAFPLAWPDGWERTAHPRASAFGRGGRTSLTVYSASQGVLRELARLKATRPVISSNMRVRADGIPYSDQKRPKDAGVAVYFELTRSPRVLACDRWNRVEDNLRAVELHIGSIRGQERWGVGTVAQAFAGYLALAEKAGGTPWWEVFGWLGPEGKTSADVERNFRELAHMAHPDKGGDIDSWLRLQDARSQALAVVRGR